MKAWTAVFTGAVVTGYLRVLHAMTLAGYILGFLFVSGIIWAGIGLLITGGVGGLWVLGIGVAGLIMVLVTAYIRIFRPELDWY